MAISDRIAVMNAGIIQHIGTPKNIYQRPANLFVSAFIGRSNIIRGELSVKEGNSPHGVPLVKIGNYEFAMRNVLDKHKKAQTVTASIRPEELLITGKKDQGFRAIVDDCVFLGLNTHYFMHLEDGTELISIQESSIENTLVPGTEVYLAVNTEKVNLFTEDGSANILAGVVNDCEKG
jgi:iron(III) transport system ATP-binding protein